VDLSSQIMGSYLSRFRVSGVQDPGLDSLTGISTIQLILRSISQAIAK